MRVPFVDLKAQYESLRPEIDQAVLQVMSETAFVSGRYAKAFEDEFAEYLGARQCVAVANGTDAIEIGLKAIGVEPGDEVIVPANSFIATAEGVSNIGAIPVFVDCDPIYYTIDTSKIEAKITSKTKAIIPVHLYGLPADMDEVLMVAKFHGLKVLEDAAQAHGATHKEHKAGTFGDAATFSFYPSKNLGAYGDAGAIVTNDHDVAERARLLANHGQISKNRHTLIGRNSRMDGIQAAVLSVKLKHLDDWTEARRRNAAIYDELLQSAGFGPPRERERSKHVYHLYVIRVDDRDKVIARLSEAGIETGIHYPTAIPFLEAYSDLGCTSQDVPVSHANMGSILSLPMYAELTGEMIEHVCETLTASAAVQIA